jgi:L-histidine Nalpha-methyltransferase
MASAPRMAGVVQDNRPIAEFCSDIIVGLSHPGQKELPSKYLYDEVGSALFDVICLLPEYGLSRAGMPLLQQH